MNEPVECPYCGEPVEVPFDEGVGASQSYIEDCIVCCRPILIVASTGEDGEPLIEGRRIDG